MLREFNVMQDFNNNYFQVIDWKVPGTRMGRAVPPKHISGYSYLTLYFGKQQAIPNRFV
jgi:hypothetical protein